MKLSEGSSTSGKSTSAARGISERRSRSKKRWTRFSLKRLRAWNITSHWLTSGSSQASTRPYPTLSMVSCTSRCRTHPIKAHQSEKSCQRSKWCKDQPKSLTSHSCLFKGQRVLMWRKLSLYSDRSRTWWTKVHHRRTRRTRSWCLMTRMWSRKKMSTTTLHSWNG